MCCPKFLFRQQWLLASKFDSSRVAVYIHSLQGLASHQIVDLNVSSRSMKAGVAPPIVREECIENGSRSIVLSGLNVQWKSSKFVTETLMGP